MTKVIDFYSKDCGTCKQIAPMLERKCKEFGIELEKIDVEEQPELAQKYEVSSLPTLILFKEGQMVDEHIGSISPAKFEEWVND